MSLDGIKNTLKAEYILNNTDGLSYKAILQKIIAFIKVFKDNHSDTFPEYTLNDRGLRSTDVINGDSVLENEDIVLYILFYVLQASNFKSNLKKLSSDIFLIFYPEHFINILIILSKRPSKDKDTGKLINDLYQYLLNEIKLTYENIIKLCEEIQIFIENLRNDLHSLIYDPASEDKYITISKENDMLFTALVSLNRFTLLPYYTQEP